MKRTLLWSLVLCAGFSAGCGSPPAAAPVQAASRPATQPVVSVVDADEFERLRKEHGYVILDVRSAGEYADGHLAGSILIDINAPDFDRQVAALDRGKPVLVHCRSGRRSAVACERMSRAGFVRLYDLEGGIMAWESAGKPVEK